MEDWAKKWKSPAKNGKVGSSGFAMLSFSEQMHIKHFKRFFFFESMVHSNNISNFILQWLA